MMRVLSALFIAAGCFSIAASVSAAPQFALASPLDAQELFVESRTVETSNLTDPDGYLPRWFTLPATPVLPKPFEAHRLHTRAISLWYATFPAEHKHKDAHKEPPVVFLHGGFASCLWWGHQIAAVRKYRNVIAVDSRAQGRRTSDGRLTYDLMKADVVALLDHLKIPKAAVVGWSDGAIIGLDMLVNAPDRLDRLFAFAPNYSPSGTKDTTLSPVFTSYVQRAASIYAQINPHPSEYNSTVNLIRGMWSTLPQWDQNTFANVTREMGSRVWIVDGDYDEAVERSQIDDLARWIPEAGELLLPQVSHFAFIQDEPFFTRAVESFLALKF